MRWQSVRHKFRQQFYAFLPRIPQQHRSTKRGKHYLSTTTMQSKTFVLALALAMPQCATGFLAGFARPTTSGPPSLANVVGVAPTKDMPADYGFDRECCALRFVWPASLQSEAPLRAVSVHS